MRPDEWIGQNVRQARKNKAMSREQLGLKLGNWLHGPWSRKNVIDAEAGRRTFTAVDLVALGGVLGVETSWLIRPPLDMDVVELPRGGIDAETLEWQSDTTMADVWTNLRYLTQRAEQAEQFAEAAQDVYAQVREAAEGLAERIAAFEARHSEASEPQPQPPSPPQAPRDWLPRRLNLPDHPDPDKPNKPDPDNPDADNAEE